MDIELYPEFCRFYSIQIHECEIIIESGRSFWSVGINGIGKNILADVLLHFFNKKNSQTHLLLFSCKDREITDTAVYLEKLLSLFNSIVQIYLLHIKKPNIVDYFSVYEYIQKLLRKLPKTAKVSILFLDVQNMFALPESIYDMLINLQYYSGKKLSYIFFSEPQCLETKNPGLKRLIDKTGYKAFHFMPLFSSTIMEKDIQNEEKNYGQSLSTWKSQLLSHSHGLHGMMKALVLYIHMFPQATLRSTEKEMIKHSMFRFWIEEILKSLPKESAYILKQVVDNPLMHKKFLHTIAYGYLIELHLLDKNGKLLHPLFLQCIRNFNVDEQNEEKSLNITEKHISWGKFKVKISHSEYQIVHALQNNSGKIVTYEQLGDILWPNDPDAYSLWALSKFIQRIRIKLRTVFLDPKIIISVRGEGYRWGGEG